LHSKGQRVGIPAWAVTPGIYTLALNHSRVFAEPPTLAVALTTTALIPPLLPDPVAADPGSGSFVPLHMSPYAGFGILLLGVLAALPLDPMHLVQLGIAKYLVRFVTATIRSDWIRQQSHL